MKRVLLGVTMTMVTTSIFAVERKELMPLIEDSSAKRESAYVAARSKIVASSTNILSLLAESVVKMNRNVSITPESKGDQNE